MIMMELAVPGQDDWQTEMGRACIKTLSLRPKHMIMAGCQHD